MTELEFIYSTIAVFFYVLAISSTFISKNIKIWGTLLLTGICIALYTKHLSLISLPYLFMLFVFTYGYYRTKPIYIKTMSAIGFIIIVTLILLNKIPGASNWLSVSSYQLSSDALPLSIYLGFDAPIIGLAIVALGIPTIIKKRELKYIIRKLLFLVPIMLITVILLAIYLGYVKVDLKITPIFFIWSLSNLFFTCVTEEAIFRRFFQDTIQNIFSDFQYGNYYGIILASIIFGLAHFSGGILYIILATVAGLFYGIAYHITGRLEASISCHYILNTTHFIFFTYPALASAL